MTESDIACTNRCIYQITYTFGNEWIIKDNLTKSLCENIPKRTLVEGSLLTLLLSLLVTALIVQAQFLLNSKYFKDCNWASWLEIGIQHDDHDYK
ncbi:hypothetical protein GQX74_004612 [Glossina fuscipes]|nr:hypothetical protein GQX74_004612 [Glossina fuscipes]